MKNLLKIIILLFVIELTSCTENLEKSPISNREPVSVEFKGYKETLQYYKNIAKMAQWYAQNPNIVKQYNNSAVTRSGSENELEQTNTILEKLQSIVIESPEGKSLSFFDLNEEQILSFLEEMPIIEANELSEKIDKFYSNDTKDNTLKYYKDINNAFVKGFNEANINNATRSGSNMVDPYFIIKKEIDNIELKNNTNESIKTRSSIVAKIGFWGTVFAATNIELRNGKKPSLDMKDFFNKIKKHMKKGRLLISLPGGNNVSKPLVVYTKSWDYDFGHVAVISKDENEAEKEFKSIEAIEKDFDKISAKEEFSISIGTDSKEGMRDEKLDKDWAKLHAITYVGQIYDVKYKFWKKNIFRWGWRKVKQDVNNYTIFANAQRSKGTPYCNPVQILTAKLAAPERLICSSAAWWYAKKGVNVNIGDWWKPTIFPAGVYLSDRVRIVGSTLDK